MRDLAALTRTGLARYPRAGAAEDPRIHASLGHLRSLEGRAKALRFLPRQPAGSALNGRHASRLRGRGLDFEELRGYLPGDDVRSIDWKVTARTGEPYIRVYGEERDRPALILVDQRMSMFFGSRLNMKSVTAAEAGALAAFRILDQGDRVGGIVFGDTEIAEVRPQRHRRAIDRLIAAIATANGRLSAERPPTAPMPLNRVLRMAARIARRDHLVMIVSDFDGIDMHTRDLVGGVARHNDVVLVLVSDPIADEIPGGLSLVVSDGLSQAEIDTGSGAVRRALSEMSAGRLARVLDWQRSIGVPVLPLSAGKSTIPQVRRLMRLGEAAR